MHFGSNSHIKRSVSVVTVVEHSPVVLSTACVSIPAHTHTLTHAHAHTQKQTYTRTCERTHTHTHLETAVA